MQINRIFFNSTDRLRSGWRASIYVMFVLMLSFFFGAMLSGLKSLINYLDFQSPWIVGFPEILSWVVLFGIGMLAGWFCCRLLEDLPWRCLGWSRHKGAMRDLLIGCLVGAGSIAVAALIATVFGGLRFGLSQAGARFAVGKTLLASAILFFVAAAAEESVFRGYALQTFTRAGLAWVGMLLPAFAFAVAHLANPNVVPGFTLINTALAGIWLAAAYLRTRSLWFPLGIHWAWNWTMAAIFGIPVSGITELTPNPLFRASDFGPAWLTGGAYGLEGGAACTIALIVSILFLWRTKLVSATSEMLELTSHEIPKAQPALPVYSDQPPVSD